MQPPVLQYESAETISNRRPVWVYAILVLYLLLLLAVIWVPAIVVWENRSEPRFAAFVGGGTAALLLAGGSLLLIPLRARRRRPIARASIWLPLIGSSICIAILIFAGGLGLHELLRTSSDRSIMSSLSAGIAAAWIVWLAVFSFMSRRLDAQRLSARLYQSVFVGSILELLVAVPMHVVVRRRNECCAGIYTGFAICVGAAMAIVALGPAVFVLYHRRWKQIHQPKRAVDL